MDAAYNSVKKTVLFVVAIALLLAAPVCANAQSIVINPVIGTGGTGTIQISNAGCNDYQILNLTSTGDKIPITVSVSYLSTTDTSVNGYWLHAILDSSTLGGTGGTTTTGTLVASTIPAASPSTAGINLTIGMDRAISPNYDQALVTVTPSGGTPIVITVNYIYNSSCGGNTGSIQNGFVEITPGTLTMTAPQGSSEMFSLQIQNLTGSTITFSDSTPVGDTWLSTNALSNSVAGGGTTTVNVTASAIGLNVTTYTSHVTVTPATGFGVPMVVTVTFAVTAGSGGGTGSGTLLLNGVSTTSQSFSYIASGSSATGLPGPACIGITESNSSLTSYSDSFTTTGGSWLNVNGSAFSPQTNQSFGGGCLYVQPNNAVNSLSSGVYTATITASDSTGSTAVANITLFVSAGSAQNVTVSPNVNFSFPPVPTGATATESQLFTVTGISPITLGTAVQSSASWLNMTTPTGVGTGTELFTLTANPSGLGAGIYSATITVPSSTPTGTTTILVSLAVGQSTGGGGGGTVTSTVVPTSLSFASEFNNYNWGSGSERQAITITGASGTMWSSSVSYGAGGSNWLQLVGSQSGTFGSSPALLLVDIQPTSLAASATLYTATITVTTPSGTYPVNVSLLVTATGSHVLLASPASTSFTYNNGGANPASQKVAFSDTNEGFPGIGQSTPAVSVTTSTAWLTATSIGNTMTLTANQAGLATGAYLGTVTVTALYPNSPLTYPVVFVVNGGTSTGPLTLSTSGMTFNATASGSLPTAQNLTVTAAAGSTGASVAVSEQSCSGSTWLFISPSGGFTASTSNSNFLVSVSQSGIAAGSTCSGTISFTTSSGVQPVSVSMVVASSGGTSGNVTVTPSTLQPFSFTIGGSNPATQTLSVVNSTSGTAVTAFTVTSSATWLTTNVTSSVNTPFNLVVTANPSGLTASSTAYTGTLTINPSGGTAVVLNVTFAIAGTPVISATPTTMPFTYLVGSSNPPTQTVFVSGGGAAATFTATPSSSGWLQLSATSGTTPNTGTFNITVTANPLNLNAGQTYNGSITIAGTGTATGSTIVNVTFTVSAPLPTIVKVTNAASYATGPVSPGEIISIFADLSGAYPIGPTPAVYLNSTNCPSPCTSVPTTMGGVQVIFLPQGIAAPLTYVGATQINCVVPYEVQTAGSNLSVKVEYLGQASNAFVLQTAATAPGIFTSNYSGTGTAAMGQTDLNGTYQGINSSSNPASPGWYLTLWVTGEGFIPSTATGSMTSTTTVKPPLGPPTVLIDGLPAGGFYFYYAEAYGFVSGLMQVNVQIPTGIRTGQADAISLSIGGNTSQSGVTVQIK